MRNSAFSLSLSLIIPSNLLTANNSKSCNHNQMLLVTRRSVLDRTFFISAHCQPPPEFALHQSRCDVLLRLTKIQKISVIIIEKYITSKLIYLNFCSDVVKPPSPLFSKIYTYSHTQTKTYRCILDSFKK